MAAVNPRPPSKAEARRLREELRAKAAAPPAPLPASLEARLDGFQPLDIAPATWKSIKATVVAIMRRSHVRGEDSFAKHITHVAAFAAWAHDNGRAVTVQALMDFTVIDDYIREGTPSLNDKSRDNRRSRLRKLAEHVNPGVTAPPRPPSTGYVPIKAPYTATEEAAIVRLATTQPSSTMQRQLCAVVGLGLGAGLDSSDLRHLRVRDIDDRGDAGIIVAIPGKRSRVVFVRRDFEHLVRASIAAQRPGALVIGVKGDRRNVAGKIVEKATIIGDAPKLEQSRLRSTWLLWLLQQPVPLPVVMRAAGLTTARTLVDLVAHIPETDPSALRDGSIAPMTSGPTVPEVTAPGGDLTEGNPS
ncbi:MAG: hypothetical protein ACLGI8_07885 [Acidimicrobiia bacterium]